LVLACSKGKLETIPKLELKSLSTTVVPVNGTLRVLIKVRDKEGDISDTLFVRKVRLNKRPVNSTLRDSFPMPVPEVPAKTYKSEFQLDLRYQEELVSAQPPLNIPGTNPPQKEPDSLIFKFALKDKANHVSDTLVLPMIIVMRN
jgi:hypothetical protein